MATLSEQIKADIAKREKAKQESTGIFDAMRKSGLLFNEAIINPNKYNAPAANRFKDSALGLLSGVPGVGDYASGAQAADYWNRGERGNALLAGLGALPLVPAIGGMFIGKGAKTWDVLKAQQANELLAKGIDPREVWKQTGTMRGADKALRQEIPDNAATWVSSRNYGDRVRHPDGLYSTYENVPNHQPLGDIPWYPGKGEGGAYFSPEGIERIVVGGTDNQKLSSGLHELQHAIQQREGWARGGSPGQFASGPMFDNKARDLSADLSRMITGGIDARPDEIVSSLKYADPKDLATVLQKYGFNNTDDAVSFLKAEDMKRTPFGQYQRLAGEAEARLTQSRMNMTMPERLASYPPDMFDVPMDQQIVRMGDNGPAMSYADEAARPRNAQGQIIQPTQYELAHQAAQRNAMLPVDQGGLGLPQGNTAIERARAMGFETQAYHGTNADIPAFDLSRHGQSYQRLDNPPPAVYTGIGDVGLDVANAYGTNGSVYPLRIKDFKLTGADAEVGVMDYEAIINNPSNIRSRFAAFDPAKRDSADLLAGVAPWAIPALGAGLLGAAMMPSDAMADDDKKAKPKKK